MKIQKFLHLNQKLFGKKILVTCIDHFSKFAWVFNVQKCSSAETLKCLEIVYEKCNDNITAVHTDIGTEFKKYFDQFLIQKKIKHKLGAPFKPTTQGCIERFNQTLQVELENSLKIQQKIILSIFN